MASRVDFYFRQRVTERELDLAFDLLEQADRDLASDIGLFGILSGAEPAPHAPVADLTIDLTAPGRAYDRLGQRIAFGTGQRVDVAVDHTGIPTDVRSAANERWLGVFLRFDRLLSDPRTDGHSARVHFRRDEHFQIVVRQAPEGPVGAAARVPLEDGELLVCDVRRRAGATQVTAADIDTSRRQAFLFARGDSVGVASALWSVLSRASSTVQDALDEIDRVLAAHGGGTALRHRSTDVEHAPRGPLTSTTVGSALDELVDRLAARTDGTPGASLVGADAVPGSPLVLPAGSVDAQLAQLLTHLNAHVGARTGAHSASAVSLPDSGGALASTNVASALAELLVALNAGHFRATEPNAGQHKAIVQPVLGSGRVLLFDAQGAGSRATRTRFYLDGESFWITINARWDGTAWARDAPEYMSALRLSRTGFELLQDTAFGSARVSDFQSKWTLPMRDAAALELTGPVQQVGHLSVQFSNPGAARTRVTFGGAITFRNRFLATPSSITLTPGDASAGFTGLPAVYRTSRDGFSFYTYQTLDPGQNAWWHGTYTAVA